MGTKSYVARKVGNIMVYVHADVPPTDAEWEAGISFFKETSDPSRLSALVYTQGGAPNAAQRARLNAVLGSNKVRIGLLTASAAARAAGVAVRWFNPELSIFGPEDVEAALDHIRAPTDQRSEVKRALTELKSELSIHAREVRQ
jgi:hypothetical protein